MRLICVTLLAGLTGLCLWAGTIRAENTNRGTTRTSTAKGDTKNRPRSVKKQQARLDAKARAAATAFARKHHPELADLLSVLKRADTDHYETALRELSVHADRLAKMAERDDERYAVSLAIWKHDSRFRLAVARLTMAGDDEIETIVRPMLVERSRLRMEMLELEEKRTKARLQRVREQIATLSSADRIANEIERIRRSINRDRRTKTDRAEPTSKETARSKTSSRQPSSE